MKLLRYGPTGREQPGILDSRGQIRALAAGPWLVTRDGVGEVQNLGMWLDVNGQRMQTGNTKTMIFGVATLVSYISRFLTLEPGDIITTGTPPGVVSARSRSRFS